MKSNNNQPAGPLATLPRAALVQDANGVLTRQQLAKHLKVSLRTIEEWQAAGVLPYLKVGRVVLFHWPDVIEHLRKNFRVCHATATTETGNFDNSPTSPPAPMASQARHEMAAQEATIASRTVVPHRMAERVAPGRSGESASKRQPAKGERAR